MTTFTTLFQIIAPVFVCAALGYFWTRRGSEFDVGLVTALVSAVGAPCLVFHTLTSLQVDVAALTEFLAASIAALGTFAVIGAALLTLLKRRLAAFLPAMVFPNCGNMGLPLCLLAFGEAGLALALVYFVVFVVGQFTLGAAIASGDWSFGRLARIPVLYAVVLALVFMISGTQPPAWIDKTAELLGGITIPLMLITLGVSLASLELTGLRRGVGLAVIRLPIGFLVGWGLAWVFGLEGTARGVLIVQSAMPIAVFNYLFAARYQTAPEEVAAMVLTSTVVVFATLPALLWYVL